MIDQYMGFDIIHSVLQNTYRIEGATRDLDLTKSCKSHEHNHKSREGAL